MFVLIILNFINILKCCALSGCYYMDFVKYYSVFSPQKTVFKLRMLLKPLFWDNANLGRSKIFIYFGLCQFFRRNVHCKCAVSPKSNISKEIYSITGSTCLLKLSLSIFDVIFLHSIYTTVI